MNPSASATIDGIPIPERADRTRMRADRHARLQTQLDEGGLDALLLLGTANVSYAIGADAPANDAARSVLARQVALIVADEPQPYLRTPYPEGAPSELPAGRVGPAAYPDLDDGAADLAAWAAERTSTGARIGMDETPHPLRSALADVGVEVVPASKVLGAAKLNKTVDEVACIRAAQRLTEAAMADVVPLLRPGVRQHELSAVFLRRVFELGVENVGVDPIWQAIAPSRALMPTTVLGDLGFPTATTQRAFADGEVIWNDTGLHVGGYASDFGRTWIVGDDPTPSARQQAQCDRWRAVVEACKAHTRPGVATIELCRLATEINDGVRPWLSHFYLAHGIGTTSAEMPMLGTDLGESFDEAQVLSPGQILVYEPVIWDEGAGGYRSEEVVAVTDDGAVSLCDFPFSPFEEAP